MLKLFAEGGHLSYKSIVGVVTLLWEGRQLDISLLL